MKYIFLHGLGQNSSSWEKTIAAMESKSYIYCPDLFKLLKGKEVTYSNIYQGFSPYCEAISEPLNICGLSLGGILTLQYATENPDKINSIVLMGTQYIMPKRLLKFQNGIFHLMPDKAFKNMGIDKKDVIGLSNSMMDLNFEQSLHRINCPVLILCGERDRANMKASLQMKELIPKAEFKVIKNAGHEINTDVPEELGRILNKFFKENEYGTL